MSNKNDVNSSINRRKILRTSAGLIAAGGVIGTSSAQPDGNYIAKLRGSQQNPISKEEIERTREYELKSFIDDGGEIGEFGLKDLDSVDENIDIVAYNLIIDENGGLSENYVDSVNDINPEKGKNDLKAASLSNDVDKKTAEKRADLMLEETLERKKKQEKSSRKLKAHSHSADTDYDWGDLGSAGGSPSEVSTWSDQSPYGDVRRIHEVRTIPGTSNQYAVKAKARMNSGYNLSENRDRSGYSDDYHNKECEIITDWGSGDNVDSEDLAPKNEIDSGETVSFGATAGVSASRSAVDASIGVSYNYTKSANEIADTSDTRRGEVAHKMSLHPDTKAGRTTAEFPSYSAGKRSGSCDCGKEVVEITVDPTWDDPPSPISTFPRWYGYDWGSEVTDTLRHYCGPCYSPYG